MKNFNDYNSEQDLVVIIGYSQLHANILVLYNNLKLINLIPKTCLEGWISNPNPNPNPFPNPIRSNSIENIL